MPTSQVPLEVESYYLRELHLGTNTDYDYEQPSTGEVDVDFDVYPHPDKPTRYRVVMSVAVASDDRSKNEPYTLHMQLTGLFRFKPEASEETKQKMMFSNAVPILYGIARGVVGQMTASAIYGSLVLPTFNFVDYMKRRAAALEEPKQSALPEVPREATNE